MQPISGSVRSLLAGKHDFGEFDLVYSAGLYDYLSDNVAARLTGRLFSMVAPGGRLVVANFHRDLHDIAGMETMMRWWLIYRDEWEVAAFAREIDPIGIRASAFFAEYLGIVAWLELCR